MKNPPEELPLTEIPQRTLTTQEPSVAMMLGALIEKGVTGDTVGALERLCDLKMKMDDRQAEQAFNVAFNEMQGQMTAVKATKSIKGTGNVVRSTFAPFEEIMASVGPILSEHGFSVSFNSRLDEKRITAICKLRHRAGHSETSEFAVTIGTPPGASAAQGDGSTMSYAKRYSLCNMLNIVVTDMDDDARLKGEPITTEQVEELKTRLGHLRDRKRPVDEAELLKLGGAAQFEAIPAARWEDVDAILFQYEVKAKLRNPDGEWTF